MTKRKAKPAPRPPWCGRCSRRTRQLEVGSRRLPVRCPWCHPLAAAPAVDDPPAKTTKGADHV